MDAGAPPPRDLRPAAQGCGVFAVVLGATILVGWTADVWALTRIAPDLPAAMPNTGLMFVLCGVVLLIEGGARSNRWARVMSTLGALLVVALAAATLFEYVADVGLGIDLRIGHGYGGLEHPGRPAPHSATGFLLLGCCLLLTRWRGARGALVAGVLGAGAAATIGTAVAGYLVGVRYLQGTEAMHGMSVNTAAGFVVVLAGVFALRPDAPPACWFAGSGSGDAVARRLVVPAVVLPFLAGALAQAGASAGLYTERFGLALLIVLFAAAIQGLIFLAVRTARGHEQVRDALERERREAEERTGLVVDRIAEAVNIIGPEGSILHSNDAARAILEDLRQRHDAGPVSALAWGTIDTDGRQVPNDDLPAEVTRTTGNEVDERVLGFPNASGDVRWLRISTRTLTAAGPPFGVVVSFVDVTAARRDAAKLVEAQRRFELAFDHAPIGVCLVSLEGQILQVNRALCEMIGYTEPELLATTFQELNALNDLKPHATPLRQMVDGELLSYQMEMRYRHKDGSEVWALSTVAMVRSDDGTPLHYIGQILDVTDRRRLERQLRHQAEHDALTGVANRRVFAAELGRQLARERRYGGESSLLMIDLDGFKEINDGMGHAAGDLVLQAVGYLLTARVRDTDLVARLGGDEFAVLLPETPREGAEMLAIDIVQAVRELSIDVGDGRRASVTASVGGACTGELPDAADEDTLLAAADLAMYEAKRSGRDGYAVHLDAG
jgi:diguanylate cyclase (GGDEF)-like protein/PAS domain S-box-containing protein